MWKLWLQPRLPWMVPHPAPQKDSKSNITTVTLGKSFSLCRLKEWLWTASSCPALLVP